MIFSVFLYQGLHTTITLNASIYLAVVPIVVLFLNRLIFADPIRPMGLFSTMISFVSVLWLRSHGELRRLYQLNINQGDYGQGGSAMSWALYCYIIRLKPVSLPNAMMLTAQVSMAILLFTPVFIWQYLQLNHNFISKLNSHQYWIISYLTIDPAILSYAFWNYGISIVGGAKSATFTNATPLFAAIFGILTATYLSYRQCLLDCDRIMAA